MLPIEAVAERLGVPSRFLLPYGHSRAKVHLDVLAELGGRKRGTYVVVTGMTPTPLGEGKTVTTISLGMGLWRVGKRAVVALRQSSLGPVFGAKGGGAGGGKARIEPLTESILNPSADFHAIAQAHNLIAALTENHFHHGNALRLDPQRMQTRRVVDVNDRFLRHVSLGVGGKGEGTPRESGFDITAASEVMAILALADGGSYAAAMRDLRARLGRMVVGFDVEGKPVRADDVRAAGAAATLLTEAIHPNLMQTSEGTPALIHAGPFANIAHGCSSILADRVALALADVVVTEAGFGMDIGGEKFFDIKCRASGLFPDVAVLVATVRALKAHSGRYKLKAGARLPEDMLAERAEEVREGGGNLARQIANARRFGVPVVVSVNRFPGDHASELQALREVALAAGAQAVVENTAFSDGGAGAEALASAVLAAVGSESRPTTLYSNDMPLADKLRTVARAMYGADDIELAPKAAEQLELFSRAGFAELPVCIAKTHLSLSHDPARVGAPHGFVLPVRELRLSAGAGFVYALTGSVVTMPGLGAEPAAQQIDIDADGAPVGIF